MNLSYQARSGNLKAIKEMVKHQNVNVNAMDKKGKTALMWAANYGHIEVVKFLVKSGADVNIADNKGRTALIIARKNQMPFNRYREIVKYLDRLKNKKM